MRAIQEEQELAFAFRVAREAHIPVHIFHLYASGKPVWGKMAEYLDSIEKARSEGLDITANQYAYTAKTYPWWLWFPDLVARRRAQGVRRPAAGSGGAGEDQAR